ncbi:DUF3139 domain-containing protein [Paenibacillus arenilitoris]|uniref:DUF3139 domain-containing protein n=1 Tax=Paenibacillus arenilitoris TaxID=2772299 RepID=A0A927CLL7_9BACL|nr:DUF3139 domain-containing protein [Paenibacillus arenilitoris]MBD2869062.1 DUF3139 domain-containing protein [Paenibacillus arenilitoris]
MSKTKKFFIVMVLVFAFALVVTPYVYVQINKIVYDDRVTNYLIEEEGYKAEEIRSVKGVWGIKLPPFYAVVVFNDEPFVEYIYFAHNDVLQFGYGISDEGKQKGITEADLKHYVPYG